MSSAAMPLSVMPTPTASAPVAAQGSSSPARGITTVHVPLRLLNALAQVPRYAHADDAGADLVTTERLELKPFERVLAPTGVSIALPEGYVAFVNPRSGLAVKRGVTVLNAPGTIDAGYRGEICVPLINLDAHQTAVFEPGERIAQLVVQRYERAEFELVSQLEDSVRADGGFGSTGV